jgi:hypothetical protein
MTPTAQAAGLLILLPTLALAQAASRGTAEKAVVPPSEIEHGFHIGLSGGAQLIFNPPVFNPPNGPKSAQYLVGGQQVQLHLGFDLGERVSLGLFAYSGSARAGSDYTGTGRVERTDQSGTTISAPVASGDFTTFSAGATGKVNIVGFADAQDVKRTWIYVRVGAGFTLYYPRALIPGFDVMIFAGPGVEYFTKLRHFSIGLEVTPVFQVITQAFGLAITPNLRFTF